MASGHSCSQVTQKHDLCEPRRLLADPEVCPSALQASLEPAREMVFLARILVCAPFLVHTAASEISAHLNQQLMCCLAGAGEGCAGWAVKGTQ